MICHELATERLRLRRWLPEDREPFARLSANPIVMRYYPRILSLEQSDAFADRVDAAFEENGFGLWAIEVKNGPPFAGFRVTKKLGMHHDLRDDFDHPLLPAGHPLRRHVLYRARKP